jgi:hypothetical protein
MSRIGDVMSACSRAAMELCWLYACSGFVFSFVDGRYGPLQAVSVFLGAWAVTASVRGRGLRLLRVLALHASALGLFALFGAGAALHGEHAPWLSGWGRAGAEPPAAEAWLRCILVVAFTGAFWWSGVRHAQRADDYIEVCRRFDRGLCWLFALLFIRLLMRDALPTSDPGVTAELLAFPYLCAGLFAVARARNRDVSVAHRRFSSGHRGTLLAVTFASWLLACAVVASVVALPTVQSSSTASVRALADAADPLRHAFLIALGLAFALWGWLATLLDPLAPPPPRDHAHGKAQAVADASPLAHIDSSSAHSLLAPWVAACVMLVLVYLYHRRTALAARAGRARVIDALLAWLARLRLLLNRWRMQRRMTEAVRLYRALLRWGDHTGVACRSSETPLESATRLGTAVSGARRPIDELVAAFTAHTYGPAGLTSHELRRARSALRKLRSPMLWPARARSWLRT